jgi:hypothetical protein
MTNKNNLNSMMPPIEALDDQLFEENDFGSQLQEKLDPALLQLLDDEFDTD